MFQVGLTDKGSVFVILGSGRIQPETFAEFTPKELKKCKVWYNEAIFAAVNTDCELLFFPQKLSFVALEKSDPVGWSLKAELHTTNSVVDCK